MTQFNAGRAAAALAAAALAVGTLTTVAADAAAPTTVTITPAQLDLSQSRANGHVDFREDGLLVWTDDSSSLAKAAGYFPVSGPLPTSGSFEWSGGAPAPGMQILFDADGNDRNNNDYNLLVGEPSVYGDRWWLTNSSSATAKAADPSGADNGGNGSEWFGTLQQWKDALPNARLRAAGFSLGSGAHGSGKLSSITFDQTSYRFSNGAGAVAATDVTVDPARLGQWTQQAFSYESGNALSLRQAFVAGTHTVGQGSLRFVVNDDTNPARVERLRTAAYDDLALRDLQGLEFSTRQVADAGNDVLQQPVYLRVSVSYDGAPEAARLYFYPANNGDQGAVANDTWQRWNAGEGRWNLMGDDGAANAFTLEDFLLEHPDARIVANPADGLGGFAFQVGGGGAGQTNGSYYLDDVKITTRDNAALGAERFDLEPLVEAPVVITPPATADVTGKAQVTRRATAKRTGVRITMTADSQPADAVEGKRLVWTVKADGKRVFQTSQHFGDRTGYVQLFKKKTGKHTVTILKNGTVVRTVKVNTGR